MADPAWANAELSEVLARWCAQGESQALEFKIAVPEQARDLAKEIAAFSSSNAGQILLGVSDDGTVTGLEGIDSQEARDRLGQRLEGICRNVKPSVHPAFQWAVHDGKTVCVLQIAKGTAPMYYVDHRPYVRRHTTARPAEPDEVVEAVQAFLNAKEPPDDDSEASEFSAKVTILLTQVLRWSDLDLEDRNRKPWADSWVFEGKDLASGLRGTAAEERAELIGIASPLRAVASAIETVLRAPRVFGGGRDYDALVSAVAEAARSTHSQFIAPIKVAASTDKDLVSGIAKAIRQLNDAWELAAAEPYTDALTNAVDLSSNAGRLILQWTHYPSELFSGTRGDKLREIAKALAALRFESVYYDGGQSQQKIIGLGHAATAKLQEWSAKG